MQPSELVVDDEGRLYHLGVSPREVSPHLVLVGDPARAERVARRFVSVDHEVRRREFVTLTGCLPDGGPPVTVIGTGIGTDNVEIALIEAWAALSFDLESRMPLEQPPALTAIRVGTSGGAQRDVEIGTLCIAGAALGLDATGPYFDVPVHPALEPLEQRARVALEAAVRSGARFAQSFRPYAAPASALVTETLREVAERKGEAHEVGITVTAPGFYGASSRTLAGLTNTIPDIKAALATLRSGEMRVLNFEMESSLLFLLAQALGIEAGTVCPAISRPDLHGEVPPYAPRIEAAIDVALETLQILCRRSA